jgi:hypothetical protein
MQVSREYVLGELRLARDALDTWIADLENPMEVFADGSEQKVYPDGVPVSLSIAELDGIPENQLKAELMAMAGMLEALAAT